MNDVLLIWGPAQFYATHPSIEKLKTKIGGRWEQQKRLARAPADQFMGPDSGTATINGILYPARFGGAGVVRNLQQASLQGLISPIIVINSGSLLGTVLGTWYVDSVEDERESWGPDGERKITFTVSFKSYGPDQGGFGGGLF